MRAIPKVLALALGVAVASPAAAGFYVSAQIGGGGSSYAGAGYSGGSSYSSSGYSIGVGAGKGTGAYWGKKQRRYYRPYRPRYGGVYLYGRRYDDRERYREQPAPVVPDPVPEPPVVAAPVEPATPPDPWGPLRSNPARGVVVAPAYTIGEALPSNLPHVTLDWRRYDLAEPPPGQIYARVKRDVLLITADGRIVKSVMPRG